MEQQEVDEQLRKETDVAMKQFSIVSISTFSLPHIILLYRMILPIPMLYRLLVNVQLPDYYQFLHSK